MFSFVTTQIELASFRFAERNAWKDPLTTEMLLGLRSGDRGQTLAALRAIIRSNIHPGPFLPRVCAIAATQYQYTDDLNGEPINLLGQVISMSGDVGVRMLMRRIGLTKQPDFADRASRTLLKALTFSTDKSVIKYALSWADYRLTYIPRYFPILNMGSISSRHSPADIVWNVRSLNRIKEYCEDFLLKLARDG